MLDIVALKVHFSTYLVTVVLNLPDLLVLACPVTGPKSQISHLCHPTDILFV